MPVHHIENVYLLIETMITTDMHGYEGEPVCIIGIFDTEDLAKQKMDEYRKTCKNIDENGYYPDEDYPDIIRHVYVETQKVYSKQKKIQ